MNKNARHNAIHQYKRIPNGFKKKKIFFIKHDFTTAIL